MPRQIDHLVIAVRDLAQATADYARAGFTVTPGGEHAGGATHNALVAFGDGAYFELIAFREPERPQTHRWWSRLARGEGLIDAALLADGLAAEAARLRDAGLDPEGPHDGGRVRPDGQRVAWRTLRLAGGEGGAALPFVIEDVTPRGLRVPNGPASRHWRPIAGVAGLTLVVADLAAAGAAWARLLGEPGRPVDPEALDEAGLAQRFTLGPHWLVLLQPADATPAATHLRDHGEGPYEVTLGAGAEPGAGELLPLDATHGARIRVTA